MREILFRGKDRTGIMNNDWFYGSLDLTTSSEYPKIICKDRFNNAMFIDVDKKTIGQYTGRTDKNGKKIFEGDIIRQRNYGSIKKNTYDNKREKTSHKRFLIKKNGVVFDNEDDYHTDIINVITFEDCRFLPFADDNFEWGNFNTNLPYEVIGNIYDNPELVEKVVE